MRVLVLSGLLACLFFACDSTGDSDKTQESLKEELQSIMAPEPEPKPTETDAPLDSLATDSIPNP